MKMNVGIICFLIFAFCSGCDRHRIVPFGSQREKLKTIKTDCGNIGLQLRKMGVFYLYVITDSNNSERIIWNNMRISIDFTEVKYNFYTQEHNVYEFYGTEHNNKEEINITFEAKSFIFTEIDTCGFGPISMKFFP